jgi:integrase
MKLTDATIRALPRPESGQRDYADDTLVGFSVRVGKRAKTFTQVVVRGGKRSRTKIGTYPELSLSKAREKARDLLAEARIKKTEEPAALTFGTALRHFKELHVPTMSAGSQRQCMRLLNTYFSSLKSRRLPDLKTSELAAIIDIVPFSSEKRNAFVWVRTFLNWSWRRGYLDQNPIARLRGYGAATTRDRVLSDAELVAVWNASHRHFNEDYGALVRLLILTGQRKGQWLAFQPKFIEGETVSWAGSFMKMKRPHTIPLTELARRMIGDRRNFGDWPATSYNKRALDKGAGVTGWTLHDLRRTFATKLAELGIAPHIIERILAHQTGVISGIAAVYNRASYLPEMRSALLAFEEKLQALISNTGGTNGRDVSGLHSSGTRAA